MAEHRASTSFFILSIDLNGLNVTLKHQNFII